MQREFPSEFEANNPGSLKPSEEDRAKNLYSGLLDRSSGRYILGKKGGKSIKDFTQDWINQYLSGQPRTERHNWLSDDSGSEAPSFLTAQNQFVDDDWLGLEGESHDEDLLKTPRVADFVGRRRLAGQGERGVGGQSSKRHHHQRTETLRQEDFWGFAYDKDPQPINMLETNDASSPIELEDKKAGSPVDKPLPPPPSDAANEPSSKESLEQPTNPQTMGRPSRANSSTATPRPRKKIAWRGKNCFIALPFEDNRGSEESGYRLLTSADVEQRLKAWEEQGYDVRGFNISAEDDPSAAIILGSSSRPPFPDPDEAQEEWKTGNYAVSFPNKGEWDAYVNLLQEEKLRALGVDLGDEEPQHSISPASASMSQMGPFPGLVSSPPIPTASAASNPLAVPHPFSPHLNQSANPSNALGSLASPASQFGAQSPLLGVDQNHHSKFPFQFQPTPPAQGSLTPQSLLQAQQAGTSASISSSVSNLPSMLSPISPPNEQGAFHPGLYDASVLSKGSFDHQFSDNVQDDQAGDQLRPVTPIGSKSPPENFHTSAVEIAHPTPRGHSHNVSETLQKGLDEYGQLGRSIEQQFDEHEAGRGDFKDSDLLKSRWAIPEDEHVTQERNRPPLDKRDLLYGQNDADDNGHEGSDFDTNPSLSGTPQGGLFANQGPWNAPNPRSSGHQPKLSGSSFNVTAKEFDPLGSFSSPNFAFQANTFQHPGFQQQAYTGSGFKPSLPLANSFNTNAPSFGSGSHAQKNSTQSEFKFSSASFNVDAPVFNPGSSVNSAASAQESSGRTKIFGDFDFSQISKPPKKSKAIPIVRPDEKQPNENDREAGAVDDRGRPAPVDRNKRARHGDQHSDRDADANVPSQPLSETHNVQASQGSNTLHPPADGKENALPDKKVDELADSRTIAVADEKPTERRGTPDSEASTWAAPSEPKEENETAVSPTPDPKREEDGPGPEASTDKPPEEKSEPAPAEKEVLPEPEEKSEQPPAEKEVLPEPEEKSEQPPAEKDALPEPEEKGRDTPVEKGPEPARKPSIFMKAARAFRFKPSVAEFVPNTVEEPEPAPQDSKAEQNDLMASRFAPTSPQPEPFGTEPTKPDIEVKELEPVADAPQSQHASDHGAASSPNEEELNAIMEQLNEGSDVGIERLDPPHPARQAAESTRETLTGQRLVPPAARSDAPSPSPNHVLGPRMLDASRGGTDLDAQSHAALSLPKDVAPGTHSPVRQLANENDHISDWDDMIYSGEEEKLVNRSRFFDRRINDLVGSAIEERFSSFERALSVIQHSVASIASGTPKRQTQRSTSAEVEDSDADDEDEEEDDASLRTRSPINQRDRKFDKLKSVILDALASHEPPQQASESEAVAEMARLRESFAELQAMTMANLSHDPMPNMRATIHEIITSQLSKRPSDAEEIGADSLMLQIDGLKNMLRVADARAEEEYKLRRESQDSVAELQRHLKIAETEAARHSEAAESAEARLLQFKAEKVPYFENLQFRSDSLMQEHEKLKLTIAELSSKNITLEGTLDEHRVTADNSKRELEATRVENKKFRDTIDHLRMRVEDSMSIRQNLTEKFDRLQDDMTAVQHDVARDQAAWRKREEEQVAKYNELRATCDREVKLREKLEHEVSELEQQEKEAAKLKFIFGQSQQENARLEELTANLRAENHSLEVKATQFEREFNEARENSRMEIQRTRASLESDLEAANNQVNMVRAELEAQIIRVQAEVDNVRLDSDTSRERYEMLLEEAKESKASALAAAAESKEVAMDEQRKLHERNLNDLRERHARALHNSSEDKQRIESHLMDRLTLSDEKVQHLQGRANHLEERLEIAQSAARAAAEAAQAKGASPPPLHSTAPSMAYGKGTGVPEKISPQALRESILVLQDQLQQREARIEQLEQEVSSFDKEAPNKLKEKDTEINWLRELLGVRSDELQDIINTLSQPSFDHNAVQDAAIRLRTNLQMQLQERERALAGQSFPSLRSISELTASPRSFPLAAAAAFGNWRRGREHAGDNISEQTPSKAGNASAFLSGLLTPPGSNVRQAPHSRESMSSNLRRSSGSRPLKSHSAPRPLSARQGGSILEPPRTPPLLRQSNYDHDAEPASYDHDEAGDEDGESTADGLVAASARETAEEPFGPRISED